MAGRASSQELNGGSRVFTQPQHLQVQTLKTSFSHTSRTVITFAIGYQRPLQLLSKTLTSYFVIRMSFNFAAIFAMALNTSTFLGQASMLSFPLAGNTHQMNLLELAFLSSLMTNTIYFILQIPAFPPGALSSLLEAPNPPLNSDPACFVFRSFSCSVFLGFVQRLGAGVAG
jgi:hypothetical protein